jgi:hypothetical protein
MNIAFCTVKVANTLTKCNTEQNGKKHDHSAMADKAMCSLFAPKERARNLETLGHYRREEHFAETSADS